MSWIRATGMNVLLGLLFGTLGPTAATTAAETDLSDDDLDGRVTQYKRFTAERRASEHPDQSERFGTDKRRRPIDLTLGSESMGLQGVSGTTSVDRGLIPNAWPTLLAMAEDGDALAKAEVAMADADAGQPAGKPKEYNDGQDPTRPLWCVDVRYRTQQTTGDTDAHLATFRIDMPVALDPEKGIPGGAIYTRIDVPVAYTDQVGTDNPNGDYEFEFTDSLMQNIYLPPFDWVKENLSLFGKPFDAIAVGIQWGFPTGGGDFVSREQFAIAPVFAWKWDLDGPNTFIAPVWRYRVDFANVDNGSSREDVSELTLQPYINISTKKLGWWIDFITFWETQEIKLNFADERGKDPGDLFIPFEMEVGKLIGKTVYSVDFAVPIYKSKGFDAYDWFVEFRVGFLF